MAKATGFYDEHTIMVKFPETLEDPEKRCAILMHKLVESAKTDPEILKLAKVGEIDMLCKISVPRNVENKHFGYGYIWFESSAIHHMLCGKNPNGSLRMASQPDPNWKPKAKPSDALTLEEITAGMRQKAFSWEDFDDDVEETVPTISVPLPPLLTFPEDLYIVNEGAAFVKDNADILPYKLICTRAPPGITVEQITQLLLPHATVKEQVVMTSKGRKQHKFPRVEEQRKKDPKAPRTIVAEFCPNTRDAQFAKLIICKMVVNIKGRTETLIWKVCNAK